MSAPRPGPTQLGASMTLLSDARQGRKGGFLPWALLIIGSSASLAANVAVAEPTLWSQVIHAWPSFALIGAYELLMRQFRTAARSVRTTTRAQRTKIRLRFPRTNVRSGCICK